MSWIKELPKEECILPGTTSCIGCGAALSLRLALRVLGKRTILIIPANCTAIIQGSYPKTTFTIPVLNVAFASSAAIASGLLAALRVRDITRVNVVVWAGDGATSDIGLSALSNAAYRQEDMLYICYDNEGYMNTGVQESGATPYGALTANSPRGKRLFKKNMPLIMNDHNIPYIATANISYVQDFVKKIRKALTYTGFKYIHLFSPCPPGWRIPANETIRIGRLAVETGVWALFEIENGRFRLNVPSVYLLSRDKRKPIEDYLGIQERFKQLRDEEIKLIEKWIDDEWKKYSELQKLGASPLEVP